VKRNYQKMSGSDLNTKIESCILLSDPRGVVKGNKLHNSR